MEKGFINLIFGLMSDKLGTEQTERHDGTESTLNNKARWRSLRIREKGNQEEAGR